MLVWMRINYYDEMECFETPEEAGERLGEWLYPLAGDTDLIRGLRYDPVLRQLIVPRICEGRHAIEMYWGDEEVAVVRPLSEEEFEEFQAGVRELAAV